MGKDNKNHKLDYENLVDMFPCALYVIRDLAIIDCNSAAVKMFGYDSKDEVLGKKLYDFFPDRQPDGSCSVKKYEKIIKDALNSDKETAFKWMHKRKNEDTFLANVIIYNKNGNLYAVMTDIDEVEQLKEELAERNTLYRMVFENYKTAMLLIDPDTGDILKANKAAVKYYKYAKEKLLSLNIKDICILAPEQIDKEMQQTKSEKISCFTHRLADGELREVEVYSFPIQVDSRILLFSIINDISDKLHKDLMFDTLFLNSPYAVVILDKEQRIIDINKNFTRIFQFEVNEVKGKLINQLLSFPENKSQIDKNIELVCKGEIIEQQGIRRRKDGKLVYVEITGYPVISRQSVIGAYAIYNDITEKKAYEERLKLFENILENNSEGVAITDTNGDIEWVNTAFEKITEYSLSEVLGKNMNILKSGIQQKAFYEDMWRQIINGGTWSKEIWNKTKKGQIYSEWLTIRSIKDNSGNIRHYVGIFKDLSEKKKIDRRMAELQQKDILTGLYNRDYFLKIVNNYIKKCKHGEQFSVIFLDIEGFKEINNSLGHHTGDKLLVELSKRLLLWKNDDFILSRYSGDEFAILCKLFTNEADMKNMTKALLDNIRQPFVIENTVLSVTTNIGISRFPDDGRDAETLIRNAQIAMYKQKGNLEEKICFYSKEMAQEIEQRFRMANLLTTAILNRELSVYYQPIFDIKNPENIVGMEALLRWKNPVLGEVSPDEFIPLAEKTGHIIHIGEWVLEQVCKQINLWQNAGYRILPVSVNVSVKQVEQIEFPERVIKIIKQHNIKPNDIELEITESIYLEGLPTIENNLKKLKKYGIKISMDDFGTGFSSLSQLGLFELDKLKIDKIFIKDLFNFSKKQNLIKSIIVLAKNLNLTVVAEGIETVEQLKCLKKFGCQLGQGYLLSEPLPAEKVENLLQPTYKTNTLSQKTLL